MKDNLCKFCSTNKILNSKHKSGAEQVCVPDKKMHKLHWLAMKKINVIKIPHIRSTRTYFIWLLFLSK